MANLAIIPARGGSKRIPRKNVKNFSGKPIIGYSINAALNSGLFDEVMVSTDDTEIAEIAKNFGAKVPFLRSENTSDDYATTAAVIDEVLQNYKEKGREFEVGCCIYPTAPFIREEKLKESIVLLEAKSFDTVFPVVEYSYPVQRAIKIGDDNKMSLFYAEHKNSRSQDLESSYHDAGQFYTFNAKKFALDKELWTENTGLIILDELEVQDIDTLTDWKLAEIKYELIQSAK
ncbi:MAG: pseudaminic acid cytidylyltransferase [Vicingaceae bacterium]|nr:pseudaminic acid cytidylyltransferase [Vicingaceae bacterium]